MHALRLTFQSLSAKPKFQNAPKRLFSGNAAQKWKRTALYPLHIELGGKMVEFAGWEMPLQYADSIINSHINTRQKAGLFDVGHMAQLRLSGKDRVKFLESLVVADLAELPVGSSKLSVFTNEKGGIIDDTVITNSGDYFYVVVNAGCADKDIAHLKNHLGKFTGDVKLEIIDRSLIALQGPAAEGVLTSMVANKEEITKMPFMTSKELKLEGIQSNGHLRVTRCGYTGEDGFEISVDHGNAIKLAKKLLAFGNGSIVKPTGLGPRDTLRLEAGLCLYGHDLDENITPVEGSLTWLIGKRRKEKGGFLGSEKILGQLKSPSPSIQKRVGLVVNGPPAREGATVHDKSNEKQIGRITSGTFSPILKQAIGMGYVEAPYSKIGTEVVVKVRGKGYPSVISKMPFVPTNYKKV